MIFTGRIQTSQGAAGENSTGDKYMGKRVSFQCQLWSIALTPAENFRDAHSRAGGKTLYHAFN